MKTRSVALCAFVCLLAGSVVAAGTDQLAVEVPFDFYVGEELMPAGTYSVNVGQSNMGGAMMIVNENRGHRIAAASVPSTVERDETSRLVFNRRGNKYFLARVSHEASGVARELPRSRREAEMARTGYPTAMQLALVVDVR